MKCAAFENIKDEKENAVCWEVLLISFLADQHELSMWNVRI